MTISPLLYAVLVLSLLSGAWLTLRERAIRAEPAAIYHVGLSRRSDRRAKFYIRSVWAGLICTFISLASLTQVAELPGMEASWHQVFLGVCYGAGLWGLMVIALVWAHIGKRLSDIDFDGLQASNKPKDPPTSRR